MTKISNIFEKVKSIHNHIGTPRSASIITSCLLFFSTFASSSSLSPKPAWLMEESSSSSPSDRANFLLNEVCYETRSPKLCVRFAKFGLSMSPRNDVGVVKVALGIAIDISAISANHIYRMLSNERVRSEYVDLFQTCLRSYAQVTTTLKRTRWRVARDPIGCDYGFTSALYGIRQCESAFKSKDASFLPILATNQVLKRLVSFERMFIQDHVSV